MTPPANEPRDEPAPADRGDLRTMGRGDQPAPEDRSETAPAQAPPHGVGGRAPMIATLNGVRALAALWVVLDHFQVPMSKLLPVTLPVVPPIGSYLGVELFFVLSGFIIAHNYMEKVRSGAGCRKYLWGRVARIYPLYFVTFLVAVGLAVTVTSDFETMMGHGFPITLGNFVANIFMMQSLPGFRAFNGPAWSVGCVIVAYLLFPVIARLVRRLSARRALVWALATLVGGVIAVIGTAGPSGMWQLDYHEMWLRIASEFTAGVLLWVWWSERRRSSPWWDVVAVAAAAVVVLTTYLAHRTNPASFVAMPLIALFVVACASASGPVARVLSSSVLQWGGRLSYSVILTHGLTHLGLYQVVHWEDFLGSHLVVRIGVLLALAMWILSATLLVHHGVEKPARTRLLSWWSRRRPAAVGS